MSTPVLSVRNLSKSFGGLKAVSDVSFDLQQGELLALIGPNGAGKTTCFNMLNGQLKADSGEVKLNGESILGLSPAGSGARAWDAPSRSPRPMHP
jgi:branched-chain amino acid transport system ATP-binding protein